MHLTPHRATGKKCGDQFLATDIPLDLLSVDATGGGGGGGGGHSTPLLAGFHGTTPVAAVLVLSNLGLSWKQQGGGPRARDCAMGCATSKGETAVKMFSRHSSLGKSSKSIVSLETILLRQTQNDH